MRILNSRRPEVEGTLIVAEAPPSPSPIRSIACKRNITLVNIVSTRMLMAHGFLRRIFEIFDRYETPVDMLATSEVSVSLTIDNTRALAAIRAEIEELRRGDGGRESRHRVPGGRKYPRLPGVAARVFAALGGIKTRMISQGASLLNISLVVAAADLVARGRIAAPGVLHDPNRRRSNETRHHRLRKDGTADRAARAGVRFHGARAHRCRMTISRKPRERTSRSSSRCPTRSSANIEKLWPRMTVPVVVGTTGWLSADGSRARGGGATRHGAGLESQFFHRRERVLRGWCAKPRGCCEANRSTARGPGRFITTPRKTRRPERCSSWWRR